MTAIIQFEKVSKVYTPFLDKFKPKDWDKQSVVAVDGLDLTLNEGEIFGILGNNGAGKTTIIKMLVGLVAPSSGKISVCGFDVQKQREKALACIGAVVEEPTLYSDLTGMQNLKYYAMLQGGVPKKRIDDIVEIVGLTNRINSKFKTYSLGMRQRLGIAQAIMHNPKILILDEPINGLDPTAIIQIRELLIQISRQYGTTIFISSHILSEMQELCDRVGVMVRGKLVGIKSASEIEDNTQEKAVLNIVCSDAERASALVTEKFDCQTKIVDGKLFVKTDGQNVAKINKLLVLNDIDVSGINIKKRTLEDVYKEMNK
ncbi:MAG: ABC transporter ATP-binding protein [Clostridia bacterium]